MKPTINANNKGNFVLSSNGKSCSVAVVQSIAYDNNIDLPKENNDSFIINDTKIISQFPGWDEKNGGLHGMLDEDGIKQLAETLNVIGSGKAKVYKPISIEELVSEFKKEDTIGILVLTTKNLEGKPNGHALKVCDITKDKIIMMDPCTYGDQLTERSFEEFMVHEANCVVLKG